jgi:hypothetical protein
MNDDNGGVVSIPGDWKYQIKRRRTQKVSREPSLFHAWEQGFSFRPNHDSHPIPQFKLNLDQLAPIQQSEFPILIIQNSCEK